jgi:hypothetical protein
MQAVVMGMGIAIAGSAAAIRRGVGAGAAVHVADDAATATAAGVGTVWTGGIDQKVNKAREKRKKKVRKKQSNGYEMKVFITLSPNISCLVYRIYL